MTPDERESLRVVIGASHQARHREATLQYFGRLLGEETGPGASREDRLVYAEGIYDEPGVLRLLAKHLLDQRAAAAFFDDRFRLQQDLLSQGADRALRSIAR